MARITSEQYQRSICLSNGPRASRDIEGKIRDRANRLRMKSTISFKPSNACPPGDDYVDLLPLLRHHCLTYMAKVVSRLRSIRFNQLACFSYLSSRYVSLALVDRLPIPCYFRGECYSANDSHVRNGRQQSSGFGIFRDEPSRYKAVHNIRAASAEMAPRWWINGARWCKRS